MNNFTSTLAAALAAHNFAFHDAMSLTLQQQQQLAQLSQQAAAVIAAPALAPHPIPTVAKSPPSPASKKKVSSLPVETVEYLKAWMMSPEHIAHPYPTEQEKHAIMEATSIELKQLTNWFVNNRKRFWKPRVEAKLREQADVDPATVKPVSKTSKSVKPNKVVSSSTTKASKSVKPTKVVSSSSSTTKTSKALKKKKKLTIVTTNKGKATPATKVTLKPKKQPLLPDTAAPLTLLDLAGIASAAHQQTTTAFQSPMPAEQTCIVPSSTMTKPVRSISNSSDLLPLLLSHAFVVSEQNSVVTSDDDCYSNDDDDSFFKNRSTETMDIYILPPTLGKTPSITDVVVGSSSNDSVLHKYEECRLSYKRSSPSSTSSPAHSYLTVENETTTSSSTDRDAAVLQLRRKYLSKYLREHGSLNVTSVSSKRSIASVVSSSPTPERKRHCISSSSSTASTSSSSSLSSSVAPTPRPQYRRRSVDLWKQACGDATHVNDHELPSLEEATLLFGYDAPQQRRRRRGSS